MYYVQTFGDSIVAKGHTEKKFVLREGFYEITKEQYNYIDSSADFELKNGEVRNIRNRPSRTETLQAKIEKLEAKIEKIYKSEVADHG